MFLVPQEKPTILQELQDMQCGCGPEWIQNIDLRVFESKFTECPITGCWVWHAGRNELGYGMWSKDRKKVRAHRISFLMYNGVLPEDKPLVCHHCDNPSCINPLHLFAGDHKDNGRDMSAKGRASVQRHPDKVPRGDRHHNRLHPERLPRGESHHKTTLTESDVRQIRDRKKSGQSATVLAATFGVAIGTIFCVVNRKTWGHVE